MKAAICPGLAIALSLYVDSAIAADEGCPVTLGTPKVFSEPWPQSAHWHGSEGLAVILVPGGVVSTTAPNHNISMKLFWYSASLPKGGDTADYEPGYESDFSGEIKRLDDGPNDAVLSRPTNAGGRSLGAWTILTGVRFDSAGCWRITGEFRGQTLSFVIESVPYQPREAAQP